MADDAPKKRTFRKYSYRGIDLEQLLDLSPEEVGCHKAKV
jgi:small subunit ribosomal protein S15e